MLRYLIILLDETSTSYCHYDNGRAQHKLIGLDDLRKGILFAMKENLSVQFVYPDYELPQEYEEVIDRVDHSDIASQDSPYGGVADIVVLNSWAWVHIESLNPGKVYLLRTSKEELFKNYPLLSDVLPHIPRLNITLTDIPSFGEDDFNTYKEVLAYLSEQVEKCYKANKHPQLNLLTDRMMLKAMNNCGAGDENLTLAPDGKFYICPAFYREGEGCAVGNLADGLDIKNRQLYKLEYAPICRKCDAYQCRRCIYLNQSMTLEVNTPSHEQCVVAHLERNASRALLHNLHLHGSFLKEYEIKEVDYLDPYEITKRF